METKKCTICNIEKMATVDNYNRHPRGKNGLNSKCKVCIKIEQKEYRSRPESKEKHRLYNAEWRLKNPEKEKEIYTKSRIKNSAKYNEVRKIRYNSDESFRQKKILQEIKYKERRKKINALPENMEKSRLRSMKRRESSEVRKQEYQKNKIYRDANKERLNEYDRNKRNQLHLSYVAHSMGLSIKSVDQKILETQRLIISLKRELKLNNIKIK